MISVTMPVPNIFLTLSGFGAVAYAQVPDAGALQQQLQKEVDKGNQTPPPERNALKKKSPVESKAPSKDTIDVNTFTISGLTLF